LCVGCVFCLNLVVMKIFEVSVKKGIIGVKKGWKWWWKGSRWLKEAIMMVFEMGL